jgi:hypothetical protein
MIMINEDQNVWDVTLGWQTHGPPAMPSLWPPKIVSC